MTLAEIMKAMRQCWPFAGKIHGVIEGYQILGRQYQFTLTDIALRNRLFADAPDAPDLFAAGVAEGRRRCALEIFTLAKADPALLHTLMETKPSPQRSQS